MKLALQILLALSIFLGMALHTAQAEEARTVRVGYFYLTGYHEIDAQGRMQGYGYDLLQKMRLYNDWHYEYIGHEQKWNEGFKMLERGEIDLITGVRKFPDRLEKFAYSNNPIGRSASVLVVREDDLRYSSGDYKSLYDYGQVPDFMPPKAEITRLDSFAACIEGVLEGKYDATYMYAFQA